MSGMGMYTELDIAVNLTADTPGEVTAMLQWMADGVGAVTRVPEHPLFGTSRWRHMLRGGSYYFDGGTYCQFGQDGEHRKFWALTVRCNLKNYDGEIEEFLDWIAPHLEVDDSWRYVGTTRYEEDRLPTLIIVHAEPRRVEFVNLESAALPDQLGRLLSAQT